MTRPAAGTPHRYQEDPETPATCRVCRRIEPNGAHNPEAVAKVEAERALANAEHQRRYGKTD